MRKLFKLKGLSVFLKIWLTVLFILFLANMAKAAVFCASNSADLQGALMAASSNGQDDLIKIVQGNYIGNFEYDSPEAYDLIIEGGYTGGCVSRVVDPANTVLNGDQRWRVLKLSSNRAVNFSIDGISLEDGWTNTGGSGLTVSTTEGGTITITNCRMLCNSATRCAGLNALTSTGPITLTNCDFWNNHVDEEGGALCANCGTGTITLTNNMISGNSAYTGGGGVWAYASDGTIVLTNNFIKNNRLWGTGGGGGVVAVAACGITITNNNIEDNWATGGNGGGLLAKTYGQMTLTNNMIVDNQALLNGGGVWAINSTFSGASRLILTNNTITNNVGVQGGGGAHIFLGIDSDYADIYNNIIWDNSSNIGNDLYINNDGNNNSIASIVNLFNNDFDQSTGIYMKIPFIIDPSNLNNEDPLFVQPLYDYRIRPGSPCIDKGNPSAPQLPATDFEGDPRIVGAAPDIGADEYSPYQYGHTSLDHNWKLVRLGKNYQNPVVIIGPPTYNGWDPGVVRLQNITDNSFDVRFQEWLYKDGAHALENIPYLVISDGRHQMANGSIWEAGTFSLSGTGAWTVHAFTDTFPSTPALFLTAQTFNGYDPITVRARNVTNTGFEAALFEEEDKMDGHVTEEVGYLAVYSPQLSGTVNINGTDVTYLLQAQSVDHRFVPVLSSDIKLEEEQSKDSEIGHINETISILALGDKIFTQDISSNGYDTIAIRRLAPEYGAAMEWGTVDGVDHNWMKIPLAKEYLNTVVVAKPVSSRGGDPGVIRIRNASHNSFELRYNEWAYRDGWHIQERVFYMVVEAGERSVAGLTVEAGKLNTSKLLADGWESIAFPASFSQTPSVFTSVQTYNGADPVTTRVKSCTAAGFDLTMDEEEAKNDGHTTETIGWIAIKRGTGKTNDNRSVVVLTSSTNHIPTQINFGQSMARRFPVVVSDIITTYGGDPGFLRYQNLLPSSIDLFIQEEASLDTEMNHIVEDVSLFVAE